VTFKDRRAARVLLIDEAGRALLFHGGDPARPGPSWWVTPGGGLEAEESHAEGAARELFEETGLRVEPAELGEPIFEEVTEFSFGGQAYRQAQQFFLFRVREWQVDTAGFDTEEQLSIDEHRWWSAAEMDATDELIYPQGLAGLLRKWDSGSASSVDPSRGMPGVGPSRGEPAVDPSRGVPGVDPSRGVPGVGPSRGVPPVGPSRGTPAVGPSRGEPARRAPSADPFSGDPFPGEPAVEPARRAPSADPFGGEPSVAPVPGEPSAEPARRAPSVDPFRGDTPAEPAPGAPAADPAHDEPSAEPARRAPSADPFRSTPGGGQ